MSTLEYSKALVAHGRSSWKNVHNCKLCPHFTTSILSMVNHVRRHRSSLEKFTCSKAKIEVYYCKDCDFKTDLTILFKQHINKHHGLKSESREDLSIEDFTIQNYVCEKCAFETNSLIKKLQHTSTCTERKENRLSSSSQNVTYKKNGEWYKCKKCNYKTKFKSRLKKHVYYVHSRAEDIQWHECTECPFKSKYKVSLRRHFSVKHADKEKIKWYECEKCPYKTKHHSNFSYHVISTHVSEEEVQWYECANCSYKSKSKQYLIRHISGRHSDIRSFQCENCPYKAKLSRHLKRHINIRHLDEADAKWYKCEQCSHGTKDISAFHKHKKIHV